MSCNRELDIFFIILSYKSVRNVMFPKGISNVINSSFNNILTAFCKLFLIKLF